MAIYIGSISDQRALHHHALICAHPSARTLSAKVAPARWLNDQVWYHDQRNKNEL